MCSYVSLTGLNINSWGTRYIQVKSTGVTVDSNSNHTNRSNGSNRSGTYYCLYQNLSEQLETLKSAKVQRTYTKTMCTNYAPSVPLYGKVSEGKLPRHISAFDRGSAREMKQLT
jgi:hypothetical protein